MSNQEQPMSAEGEEELFAIMADAIDHDAMPIAMMPYQGPPPAADFYLPMLQDMIERTGSATGCICFGTESHSGMFPLAGCSAEEGMHLLLALRTQGVLPSISWVTVAADSWRKKFDRRTTDPASIRKGDLEKWRNAGDATVEEILSVVCTAPDGPGYSVAQPYTRTPLGIVWADPEPLVMASEVENAVSTLMTELVTV